MTGWISYDVHLYLFHWGGLLLEIRSSWTPLGVTNIKMQSKGRRLSTPSSLRSTASPSTATLHLANQTVLVLIHCSMCTLQWLQFKAFDPCAVFSLVVIYLLQAKSCYCSKRMPLLSTVSVIFQLLLLAFVEKCLMKDEQYFQNEVIWILKKPKFKKAMQDVQDL